MLQPRESATYSCEHACSTAGTWTNTATVKASGKRRPYLKGSKPKRNNRRPPPGLADQDLLGDPGRRGFGHVQDDVRGPSVTPTRDAAEGPGSSHSPRRSRPSPRGPGGRTSTRSWPWTARTRATASIPNSADEEHDRRLAQRRMQVRSCGRWGSWQSDLGLAADRRARGVVFTVPVPPISRHGAHR